MYTLNQLEAEQKSLCCSDVFPKDLEILQLTEWQEIEFNKGIALIPEVY